MASKPHPICFLVGSTRSGTTILSECLEKHSQIAHLYEPYYIWDWDIGYGKDDVRPSAFLPMLNKKAIRRDFKRFAVKSKASIVLEKAPGIMGIDFRQCIFPDAKWINIVRDGRDVTLSIHREWKKREKLSQKKLYKDTFALIWKTLLRQPFWYFRIKQIAFELKTAQFQNLLAYHNKSKWKGSAGWGPRFKNWKEIYESRSLIEFNAYQWLESVKSVEANKNNIDAGKLLELKYEDFIQNPIENLKRIIEFLGLKYESHMVDRLPAIKKNNKNKWKTEFTLKKLQNIGPIITDELIRLEYENNKHWVNDVTSAL